jgi:hypothetical protein
MALPQIKSRVFGGKKQETKNKSQEKENDSWLFSVFIINCQFSTVNYPYLVTKISLQPLTAL